MNLTKDNKEYDYIPKGRNYTLIINCIDQVDDISLESDSNVKLSKIFNPKESKIVITIASHDFSKVKITLTNPQIKKKNLLKEQTHQLLMYSSLTLTNKMILDKLLLKKEQYSEKDLKSLYRKIKRML